VKNNKKAKSWAELTSSRFHHEPLSLFFEDFFSCDSAQSPRCTCFDQTQTVKAAVECLTLPRGVSGFGFQCTDHPVHEQQRGGRLCLRRTGGGRRVASGPAISMHECSRCSSQGRWEAFQGHTEFYNFLGGESSLALTKRGFSCDASLWAWCLQERAAATEQ